MARKGTAAGDYIRTVGTHTAGAFTSAYSMFLWYRNNSTPSSANSYAVLGLGNTALTFNSIFCWDHTFSTKTWFHVEAGGAYKTATYTTSPSADTWYALALTYDGTNMRAYLNGTLEATTAAAVSSASATVRFHAFSDTGGTNPNADDGVIAEPACWNVALSATEITALANGLCPLLIRPESVMGYWNLIGTPQDPIGLPIETNLTENYTHPRVILPGVTHSRRFQRYYVHFPSGGGTMGGSASMTTAYNLTPSGGAVVGGQHIVSSIVSFSNAVGVAQGSVNIPGTFTNSVNAASNLTVVNASVSLTHGVHVASRFLASSGELANGRYNDIHGERG